MGYTHYWGVDDPQQVDADAYEKAVVGPCVALALHAKRVNVKLEQELAEDHLFFNGVGDNAHEDFVLPRQAGDLRDFQFCKTARKPYDTVVAACLLVIHETGVDVSSDGDADDWAAAKKFAEQVLDREFLLPKALTG